MFHTSKPCQILHPVRPHVLHPVRLLTHTPTPKVCQPIPPPPPLPAKVMALPLSKALDGTKSSDYAQRVEPSALGGHKIAKLILDAMSAAETGMYASITSPLILSSKKIF